MSSLHVINRPDIKVAGFIGPQDEAILIEAGVYQGALACKTHALEADLLARGRDAKTDVVTIDHAGFVALCVKHDKVVTW